jgi:alkylhydroperoxidase family enzyme
MLRFPVPDEHKAAAAPYLLATVGSPYLLAARDAFGRALYDFQCDTKISFREREAMRMWVAYYLACNVCAGWRPVTQHIAGRPPTAEEAATIDEEFYVRIPDYRTFGGYSEREKLAIEFIERLATDIDGARDDEQFWARLKKNFSDAEIGDLGIFAGCWVSSAHLLKMFGFGNGACELPQPSAEATVPNRAAVG